MWDTVSGRGQAFLATWFLVLVVVIASRAAAATQVSETIFKTHPSCNGSADPKMVICNVTGINKSIVLGGASWQEENEMTVIGAKSLVVHQQCVRNDVQYGTLKIRNSQNVKTDHTGAVTCWVHLHLSNSLAISITHFADLLRIIDSKVDLINIDTVSQFDIKNSEVTSLTVRATEKKCTIINSVITNLLNVTLEGSFLFEIIGGSLIKRLKHLNYKSTYNSSEIKNVKINYVEIPGLVVSRGSLTLQNVTIDSLAARGITVEGGAKLIVSESKIIYSAAEGIVMNGGDIQFQNVDVGNHVNVSFEINGADGGLLPLATIISPPSAVSKWILTGFCIGLVIGSLIGGALVFLIINRKTISKRFDNDSLELLKKDTNSESPCVSSQPQTQYSQDTTRQNGQKMEDDEFYMDVGADEASSSSAINEQNPPPLTNKPPPLTNKPPPLTNKPPPLTNKPPPIPEFGTFPAPTHPPLPTNYPPPPSTVSNITSNSIPTPSRMPPPPPVRTDSTSKVSTSSSHSDDRNNLPPPPETADDDQDVYDEVEDYQKNQQPRPLVPSNKPSFLHTANAATQPGRTINGPPTKPTKAPGPTAGPEVLAGRRWPPSHPHIPNKPTQLSSESKFSSEPKPSGSTFSAEDDEEDIYETVE